MGQEQKEDWGPASIWLPLRCYPSSLTSLGDALGGEFKYQIARYLPFSSTVQEGEAGGKRDLIIQPPALPGCEMGSGQEAGDAVILPGWSRKMKDDVTLIFSLIRQQTEMEGGEQEVGGWALY